MKLRVRATPNARQSEIIGWEDDPQAGRILRVRISAPPVDGKANAALCAFVARAAGVPPSRVSVVRGQTSRDKVVRVDGVDEEILKNALLGQRTD